MRVYKSIFPACPTFFTPFQSHPRELLKKATESWVGWMRDYVCSIPGMIANYSSSVVVAGAQLHYTNDYIFNDSDSVVMNTTSGVHKKGILIESETHFYANETLYATAVVYFRPVIIGDETSAAAKSSQLLPDIINLFDNSELTSRHSKKETKLQISRIKNDGELLGSGNHKFRLYRYAMDFADQWAFMESYSYVSASREELTLSLSSSNSGIISCLSTKLSKYYIDLKKPFFLFDYGYVKTEAYQLSDKICFIHDLINADTGAVHASVYEEF